MENKKLIVDALSESIKNSKNIKIDYSRKEYLRHKLTGFIGIFIEKKNGYYGEITIIKLKDEDREYFAPSNEFEKLN